MSKKKNTKKKEVLLDKSESEIFTNKDLLPQNILLVGNKDEIDKTIYIYQDTYKEIQDFTKDKTENESGGVLVGNIINEFGKTHIIIKGFIEAKFCEATPTTLKFTHETWEYINDIAEEQYENQIIIGWIHTHPNFGIFLSEYDKFIHENFFNEEFQTAYVVDPIQHIEGFYVWINGNITKCNGFYIFDETGKTIDVKNDDEETDITNDTVQKSSPASKIVMVVLGIAVIILALIVVNLNGKINNIQQQQNQAFQAFQQNDIALNQGLNDLNGKIDALTEPISEEETEKEEKPEQSTTDKNETTSDAPQEEESAKETTTETTTEKKAP